MLEKTLDETSGIQRGDVDTLFYYIAYYNPLGNEVAFNFLSNRWDEIQTLVSKFSKQIQLINVKKRMVCFTDSVTIIALIYSTTSATD